MSQPTATARDAARERLRAVVLDNLLNVHDHTADPYTAGEAIMEAAQQWAADSTAPAAPCPGGSTLTDDGACTLCDVVKPDGRALHDHVMNVHPDDFCRLYHHQPCRAEQAAAEYLAEQRRTATH